MKGLCPGGLQPGCSVLVEVEAIGIAGKHQQTVQAY
jgi:hypothetical protein